MTSNKNESVEEKGFEALHRLYLFAADTVHGHGEIVARVLLGLYNGERFPFDLTELRRLEPDVFTDVMTLLVMDARVTRKEIHQYFDNGSKKFERLVQTWNIPDALKLKETGDGSPRPIATKGSIHHDSDVQATLVTYGNAPGYRDIRATVDCEVIGLDRDDVGVVRVCLSFSATDSAALMHHIHAVHRFAWSRPGELPLDAKPNETRPSWI